MQQRRVLQVTREQSGFRLARSHGVAVLAGTVPDGRSYPRELGTRDMKA
jgi:hypothetical protein